MPTSRIIAVTLAFGLSAPIAQAQQPGAATVSVIKAEKRPVTESVRFVGRIQAIERVDIRARVTGYLEDVLFKDGDLVKTGTPLYRIEKGPFEAAVEQAKAAKLRAQALLENATLQLQRSEELLKTSATSIAVRDERLATQKAAQGDLTGAEAALKTAAPANSGLAPIDN